MRYEGQNAGVIVTPVLTFSFFAIFDFLNEQELLKTLVFKFYQMRAESD